MPDPVTVDIDTSRAEAALDRLRRELREQLNQRKRWVPIGDVLRALDQHDDEIRQKNDVAAGGLLYLVDRDGDRWVPDDPEGWRCTTVPGCWRPTREALNDECGPLREVKA